MTGKDRDDKALEALFAGARAERAVPSADFMARLQADAEASLPRPQAKSGATRAGGLWHGWWTGIFAASGLSGAALAGVWIGFAMPETLDNLDFSADTFSADTSVELSIFLPSADLGAVFDE